jgi:hypothetical protein
MRSAKASNLEVSENIWQNLARSVRRTEARNEERHTIPHTRTCVCCRVVLCCIVSVWWAPSLGRSRAQTNDTYAQQPTPTHNRVKASNLKVAAAATHCSHAPKRSASRGANEERQGQQRSNRQKAAGRTKAWPHARSSAASSGARGRQHQGQHARSSGEQSVKQILARTHTVVRRAVARADGSAKQRS